MARGRGGRQRGGGSGGRSTQEEEEETTEVEQSLEDDTDEEEEVEHGIPVTYTEDNKIIIDIRGLWFNSKYVVRGVTASTQQKMTRGITCWSDASEEEKEGWFNNFRQNFHWPKEQERSVWERYNYIGKKRLRDSMYKVSKRKKPPQFMEGI
ncbi:uncharacterized protein LOC141638693 [Silene latifolia]|uniref:uncharacterized protein LOC141638693 n=1 Tax=Silene latifolia TaxID=37657 RepID=UPI003D78A3B2